MAHVQQPQRFAEAPNITNTNPTQIPTADELFRRVQRCVTIEESMLFYHNHETHDTISRPLFDYLVSRQEEYANIEREIMAHIDQFTDLESRFAKVSAQLVDALWELRVERKYDREAPACHSEYSKSLEIHYPVHNNPSDSDLKKHESVFLLYNRLKYWLGHQASRKSAQAHAVPGGSTLHTGTSKL